MRFARAIPFFVCGAVIYIFATTEFLSGFAGNWNRCDNRDNKAPPLPPIDNQTSDPLQHFKPPLGCKEGEDIYACLQRIDPMGMKKYQAGRLVEEELTQLAKKQASAPSLYGNLTQKSNSFQLPFDTKYCLMHLGKTAGKTVACEVGEKGLVYHCASKNPEPSRLQDAFVATTHMWGQNRACEKHIGSINAFLFILRNPIDRIISWYYYEHPRFIPGTSSNPNEEKAMQTSKRLHKWENNTQGCFSNVQEFAINAVPPNLTNSEGSQGPPSSRRNECQRLAWDVATGKQRCLHHNAFGYNYYFEKARQLHLLRPHQRKTILAIRTEHLAQDWDILEAALETRKGSIKSKVNGTMRFETSKKRESEIRKSQLKDHDMALSPQARRNLCRALCSEIQMYKHILYLAINLNREQVQTSLQRVVDSCAGEETIDIRECPYETYRSCPQKGGYDLMHQDLVACEPSFPF